jgi:type I restriction enzyme, S subunit
MDTIGGCPIHFPPLSAQKAIAAYLDKETARIDALIAKKERQIELLEEKRQAIITRAITKGLDPKAKMKDSGVEWIGEIPSTWNINRLKYIASGTTVGIVINPSSYYQDSGVICLRSLNISSGKINLEEVVYISEGANNLLSKSILHEGDIVVVRTGRAGTPAIIPKTLDGCNCIDLLIIRKTSKMLSDFIYYYLKSDMARLQVETNSVGTIQSHFNTETLTEMVFTLPPLEEQHKIVSQVRSSERQIEMTISNISQSVDLLREYRSALITSAVTGHMNVPNEKTHPLRGGGA